ncbi:cation transporter [Streptomyces sp. SP17BM10]|uniref:heavy-metal-associated domain-containing protein n=1 Tax=Streptomyces sp. SP17BM10 TaxID=3002530 RepID=UPI002E75A79D|nr:cation transporter [Streptomyces sp. SP17BM10]MEE1781564.1 cation transporter [Streptomyces sp. SP17BM10]
MSKTTVTIDPSATEAPASSCCGSCGTGDAPAAAESAGRAVFQVKGMTCGHCVSSVTAELKKIDGVTEVAVDLTTGRVTVDATAPLADEAVAAAIDEAGYDLVGRLDD